MFGSPIGPGQFAAQRSQGTTLSPMSRCAVERYPHNSTASSPFCARLARSDGRRLSCRGGQCSGAASGDELDPSESNVGRSPVRQACG